MQRLTMLILAVLAIFGTARAEEPADSIRSVIVSQLEALQENDLVAAFAHASPMIQSKFGTADVFGRMVETGYPVIWRPSHYEMQSLVESDAGLVQKLLMQDRTGRLFEAAYQMQLVDGKWRINGVYLRELPGVGS